MSKYLYGASIQGIQDFIFKTNKLKEIIGASEIIKTIDELDLKVKFSLEEEPEVILKAAGNIRCIFSNEKDLKKVVLKLPKEISSKAYGITVSQAVVEDTNKYREDILKLEKKLKIQRNKVSIPLDMNFSILKRNARTAKPLVEKENDKSTNQKVQKFQEFASKNAKDNIFDISQIKNTKGKIAIIHADGNGLGNIVRTLQKDDMKDFSPKLALKTKEAFDEAKKEIKNNKFREVILGGDDVTLICDATYAIEFTKKFLEEFESKTENIHNNLSLTACAGITFCNEKYPIHYALKLAEDLCKHAKTHAKNITKDLAPSCLMFHNIQSSNVQSYDNFIKDELTINNKRLDFGPYYLNENEQPKIENLLKVVKEFQQENSPKGRLREWLNDLEYDETYAQKQLERIKEMLELKENWETKSLNKLHKDLTLTSLFVEKNKTPIYDILQLVSIKGTKDDS